MDFILFLKQGVKSKMPKFLRRNWNRHSKLGKRRKKKKVWRRPTGRDNKMREKRKGYAPSVSIGYKQNKGQRGKLNDKKPVLIMNLKDLSNLKKDQVGLVGNVGRKKRMEIVKRIKEMNANIWNIKVEKFIKEMKLLEKTSKKTIGGEK